ncbi:MAG: hypothetical protein BWY71_00347 [Planctomycetes bacterium ADurb.Bin412]|nr:MAG: hypothetical protein BWY71_00347 [Planctomycetes bacterium ADurb.Bin412]
MDFGNRRCLFRMQRVVIFIDYPNGKQAGGTRTLHITIVAVPDIDALFGCQLHVVQGRLENARVRFYRTHHGGVNHGVQILMQPIVAAPAGGIAPIVADDTQPELFTKLGQDPAVSLQILPGFVDK